jgi:hypothetical protein
VYLKTGWLHTAHRPLLTILAVTVWISMRACEEYIRELQRLFFLSMWTPTARPNKI